MPPQTRSICYYFALSQKCVGNINWNKNATEIIEEWGIGNDAS